MRSWMNCRCKTKAQELWRPALAAWVQPLVFCALAGTPKPLLDRRLDAWNSNSIVTRLRIWSHFFSKKCYFSISEGSEKWLQNAQNATFWAKICCGKRKTMLFFTPPLIFHFRQKMPNFTNPTLKNFTKITNFFWIFKKISKMSDFEPGSKIGEWTTLGPKNTLIVF